ncbi:CBS domain-containing protein [Pontibacter sp. JAM-7]|uniref:CBS domain-containing protein n=1 Tax=Pontibacter sp. JAM-7 TaxID=3366581 RepID=UPI003AF43145
MKLAKIADFMQRDFAHITPDMLVAAASNQLVKHTMLGAPVVDADGKLAGWISEQECLKVTIQVVYHNQRVATVGEVMKPDVLTVSLNQDPLALAQQMLQEKPKNYPVVDAQGKVVGVLNRRHLLTLLLDQLPTLGRSAG